MRRSVGKLSRPAIGHASRKTLILSSPFNFSTSSGNDGSSGGGGRGRGRGSDFPRFSFIDSSPGKSESTGHDDETSSPAPLGHGRGKSFSAPPNVPQFSSSVAPGGNKGTVGDRSRNQEKDKLSSSLLSVLTGVGRGKPTQTTSVGYEKVEEVNRHIKPRPPVAAQEPRAASPRMSQEDAINKARGILSRGGDGGGPQGGSGRGRQQGGFSGRGRGRGRGRSYRDDDDQDDDEEETELDKANEDKISKYLGPEKMSVLVEAFEEASGSVLPSPEEDAFVDAMHTNLLVLTFIESFITRGENCLGRLGQVTGEMCSGLNM